MIEVTPQQHETINRLIAVYPNHDPYVSINRRGAEKSVFLLLYGVPNHIEYEITDDGVYYGPDPD